MLNRGRLWLRAVLLRRRLEREMREEMAGHLDRATERLLARGLAPDAARREALREFGPVPFLQERAREAYGGRWVEEVAADLRFGRRHLARAPLTTAAMFAVLAAGIAISVLLFSAVHSVASAPPSGVVRADDLVRIRGLRGLRGRDGRGYRAIGEDELRAFRALGGQFAAVAGSTQQRLPLVVPGDPERRPREAIVTFVTDGYFPVLGVRPALGPGLPAAGADDVAVANVAVIAHRTWRQLFAGDPGVIGSAVTVGGTSVTIVGVAPERFHGVSMDRTPIQLWMPLAARPQLRPLPGAAFLAVARLRPGVTPPSATAAVRVVARQVAADDSVREVAPSAEVVPLLAMNNDPAIDADVRWVAFLVGLLALLVLLVTCTNVSALLMGLAAARRQEVAVRLALGAARARLVRQMLTESVLLAAAAGATALGVAWLALRAMAWRTPTLPFELGITWPATAFALGVALVVGVGFGSAPALHGTRVAAAGTLRDSSAAVTGGRVGLQRGLVVAQIALTQPLIALLAMVLLVALGELQPRRQTELGDRLISVRLRPPVPAAADASPAAAAAWQRLRAPMRRMTERLPAMGGVEAMVTEWPGASPLGGYAVHRDDRVAGASEETVRLTGERAAPGYLATLGIPIQRGRDFAPAEVAPARPRPAQASVVIGADLARTLWSGADPVGRRLEATSDSARGPRRLVVVGVIDDPLARFRGAGEEVRIYLPPDTAQIPRALLLRTTGAAASVLPAVRGVVNAAAPDLLADVRTIAEVQEEEERDLRVATGWISAAGGAALLLSAVGLYAVVAFAVGRRTREIAVRMSVGAPASRIVRRFVADGLRLAAVGIAVGLPAGLLGLAALPALDSDLPALPAGPVAAITTIAVIATALVAAWIPARRAAAVDPAVVLRAE